MTKKIRYGSRYFFLIGISCMIIAGWFCSCTPDDECRKTNIVRLKATLYTQHFDTVSQTYSAVSHTPDSLSVWGVENDSLLYNRVRTNSIYLPLNKNAETSSFVLHYAYAPDTLTNINVYDTLTINYTNENRFISLECGCFVHQTIIDLQMTHSALDSVLIINQQVSTTDEEHLRLFF